jgi:hypothetical protein
MQPYAYDAALSLAISFAAAPSTVASATEHNLQSWPISIDVKSRIRNLIDVDENNSMIAPDGRGTDVTPMLAIKRQYQPSVVSFDSPSTLKTHSSANRSNDDELMVFWLALKLTVVATF